MRFRITEDPSTAGTLQRVIEGTLQYVDVGRRRKAVHGGWLVTPTTVVDHKADGTSIRITCEYRAVAMEGSAIEAVGYCAGEWLRAATTVEILRDRVPAGAV